MPVFGIESKNKLAQCHPDLQRLFNEVIKHYDCKVISGARTVQEQREKVDAGLSTTMNSKHIPAADGYSHAVDVAPYPIDWTERERFIMFAGIVRGIASQMGIEITSGIDWDSDLYIKEHHFFDGPHFELKD